MEILTLGGFCVALIICVILNISILYALAFGLVLFLLYGKRKGFSWAELFKTALEGIKTIKTILIAFLLIGMLTAIWRAAGTIPVIVCYASNLIRPSILLLMSFLLNCLISFLTGTAFGTGATMGVICATMATSMGMDIRVIGGAILSGIYFGDRCSPVSTSALMASELTGTNIFTNIKSMVKDTIIPFILSCIIYAVLGFKFLGNGEIPNLRELFAREFNLHWAAVIPAIVILLLAAFKVNVKMAMGASIISALPIALFIQHVAPIEMLKALIFGFSVPDPQVAAMINGGGIVSMIRVGVIISISSAYSGIFKKTGLLNGATVALEKLAKKTTAFTSVLVASIVTGVVACNQSLTIILANQLCNGLDLSKEELFLAIADTAVVIPALIPWSIAGGVPMAAIGAPYSCRFFTFYLILVPICGLIKSIIKKK